MQNAFTNLSEKVKVLLNNCKLYIYFFLITKIIGVSIFSVQLKMAQKYRNQILIFKSKILSRC